MELRPLEAADARPILRLPNRDYLAWTEPDRDDPDAVLEVAWHDLGLQHPLWEKLQDD